MPERRCRVSWRPERLPDPVSDHAADLLHLHGQRAPIAGIAGKAPASTSRGALAANSTSDCLASYLTQYSALGATNQQVQNLASGLLLELQQTQSGFVPTVGTSVVGAASVQSNIASQRQPAHRASPEFPARSS